MSNIAVFGDLHGDYLDFLNLGKKIGALDFPGPANMQVCPSPDIVSKNPDWHIIQVGDLCHMGVFPNSMPIYRDRNDAIMLEYAIKLIDTILLGNHEAYYTHNLDTGRFWGMASLHTQLPPNTIPLVQEVMRKGGYRLATAVEAGGLPWLVTHAGLHPGYRPEQIVPTEFNKTNSMEFYTALADKMNLDLWSLVKDKNNSIPYITQVGSHSGGIGYSGVLWLRPSECDPKYYRNEGEYIVLNQIVGHTPRSDHPRYVELRKTWYIDNDSGSCVISKNGEPWEGVKL